MRFDVKLSKGFLKEIKPLLKKYRSLKKDFANLVDLLEINPTHGTPIGHGCYKIRISIKSKGKGKSVGARVISYVLVQKEEVVLLTIFDKSEKSNLEVNELKELLHNIE